MPYSITTKDGITINNIPDDVAPDAPQLRERVAQLRGNVVPVSEEIGGFQMPPSRAEQAGMRSVQALRQLQADPFYQAAQQQTPLQNIAAGFAGATSKGIPLGIRQMLGRASPEELAEFQGAMRGLGTTTAGTTGQVLGTAAPAVAAGMAPGGSTVLGSLIGGGALSAVQPVDEATETRLGNVARGALLNAALPATVAAGRIGTSLVAPFTRRGSEGIAGRTLERFATDPASIQRAATTTWRAGAPTLAEASGDIGLANLQRTMQTMDPQGLIAQRFAENNAARIAALADIAGTPAQRAGAETRRAAIGGKAYRRALQEGVDQQMAEALQPQIQNLLERPEIQKSITGAKSLAKSEGIAFDDVGSVRGLQYLKQELDDQIGKLRPEEKNKRRLWTQTSNDLKSVLDEISPALRKADKVYARLSREPNRMQVGQRLLEQQTSALASAGGSPRLYGESLARALRNEEQLVRQATGLRRGLSDVMSPEQIRTLGGVVDELSANATAQAAGRVPGSPTAQYLMGQDVVSRMAGPLGIPQNVAGSLLAQTVISRPLSAILRPSEERVVGALTEAMLDPAYAAQLMRRGQPSLLARRGQRALDVALPPAQGLLMGYPLLQPSE